MKCSKRDFSFWYSDPQFSVALLLCCKSVLCISLLAPKAFLLHRNITFFFFRDFIYLFDGESVCMRGCGRGGAEGEGEADSLLSREPDSPRTLGSWIMTLNPLRHPIAPSLLFCFFYSPSLLYCGFFSHSSFFLLLTQKMTVSVLILLTISSGTFMWRFNLSKAPEAS